jgi:uncharacterized protein YrrD
MLISKDRAVKLFVFLSEIIGQDVIDKNDCLLGRLHDIPLRISDEIYPRAAGFIIERGILRKEYAYIEVNQMGSINEVFKVNVLKHQIVFDKNRPRYDLTLCRDILDQQVVDTDNQKVVRVNDVHLLRVDNQLYLAHVDVGLRALIRRLEWTPLVDAVVKSISPKSPYLKQEEFIPWKNTHVLRSGRYKNVLRLDVARQKLSQIPPTDLADIMEDLDIFEKISLFKSLDVDVQRKVFSDLATQEKQDLIDHLDDKEASSLLENIPADEATDLLLSLPKPITRRLMHRMQTKKSKKLRKLLGFAKDSAGGLMTTEYLFLMQDACVKDAVDLLKNNVEYPGNIYNIYIVDAEHRLLGSTSLRRFINEDPHIPILQTCYPRKIFVRTDDGMEEVALLLEKYKFTSIAVLNEADVLQGVITSDDVLEELIPLTWSKYKGKLT